MVDVYQPIPPSFEAVETIAALKAEIKKLEKREQTRAGRDQAKNDRIDELIADKEALQAKIIKRDKYINLVRTMGSQPTRYYDTGDKVTFSVILYLIFWGECERLSTPTKVTYYKIDIVEVKRLNGNIDRTWKQIDHLVSKARVFIQGIIQEPEDGVYWLAIPKDIQQRITHPDFAGRNWKPAPTRWCEQCGREERIRYIYFWAKIEVCESAGHLLSPVTWGAAQFFLGQKENEVKFTAEKARAVLDDIQHGRVPKWQ